MTSPKPPLEKLCAEFAAAVSSELSPIIAVNLDSVPALTT